MFRSSNKNPPRDESSSLQSQRKPATRIPSKPDSKIAENKSSKAAQHVSYWAKRGSRSVTPSNKTDQGTKSTTTTSGPVTAAHALERTSIVPPSEAASSGNSRAFISRHSSDLLPPPTIRTPSLISGSSASTVDSPRSTALRRKPSTIEEYAASRRTTTDAIGATMHKGRDEFESGFDDAVLGISIPRTTYDGGAGDLGATQHAGLATEQSRISQPSTRDITPPVFTYAQSTTPSTRYTDSPFSHAPTPSSASSYSSAVVATSHTTTSRARQQSPTRSRPPVTGRGNEKAESSRLGLPPVRESSTSSSNSTVKPATSRYPALKDVPSKPAFARPNPTPSTSQNSTRSKLVKENPKRAPSIVPKTAVQIPPELAHLNVEPTQRLSMNKALPPLRPSRDGTSTLTGMSAPSSVVQSDLPRLYTTYHKRTPSQETPTSTSSPSLKSRFGLSPKASSKQASPRIDSAISPPPGARPFTRGSTPDTSATEGRNVSRKDSPAIPPNPSKSPRFGFFSRKPKVDTSKPTEKPKRPPSKGPTAGTGHEGYGRFSVRGRSGSSTSSADFRSPSTESTASRPKRQSTSRKGSVTSKDGSELDDFLRDRLNPVVLRGSGSTASSSSAQPQSAHPSSKNSSLDNITKPHLLPSAIDSNAGVSPSKRSDQTRRVPSDSSEDDVTARYPTLATRRSLTRLSQGDATSVVKVPAPIDTSLLSKDSSIDSYDAETSAMPQTDSTLPGEDRFDGNEGLWLRSRQAGPEEKAPRKWNFFQRAQASPRAKGKNKVTVREGAQSDVIAHQSPYRGVAHYAMLDPVQPVGLEEVERIAQENETSADESTSEANALPRVVPYERRHLSLLPSPAKPEYSQDFEFKARPTPPRILVRNDSEDSSIVLHAEKTIPHQAPHIVDIQRSPSMRQREYEAEQKAILSELKPATFMSRDEVHTPDMAQVPFNTPEMSENISPARQPRLSPVGRIPKVVSKRDRERKLSDSSFSRPFVRNQPKPTVKPPGSLYNQIRDLASPIESGSQPVSSTSTNSNGAGDERNSSVDTGRPSASTNRTSMDIYGRNEFFIFPSRKDSSYSSSSGGNNSVLAILAAQPPQQEDIWNEYDDLMDDVLPGKAFRSNGPSLGAPFQYSGLHHDSSYPSELQGWNEYSFKDLPLPPRLGVAPSALPVPQQIARLQPSMSPLTTPHALSEFFDHYGNRSTSTLASANRTSVQEEKNFSVPQPQRTSIPGPNRSSIGTNRSSIPAPNRSSQGRISRSSLPGPNRSSLPRSSRSSLPSRQASTKSSARLSRSSSHSRSASLPEVNARNSQSSLTPSGRFNRNTQLLDIAEVDGDEQAAAANLRFGALMTSKWLSFGRVLFSPAHNEMRLGDEPRVLIIDGLGSDWSYYVALSYTAATVYNLGPPPANGISDWPGVNQKPPSNHRHIPHTAISAAFPFPKGFFTAVVFRFPIATTDQAYQACIHECKRVLRPGGYLEVAALDLDLMNMGNKARKEIRGLKTRMQQYDQDVGLRNLSDILVRLIGRRGFEEIQRCFVGIPAAGRIPRSQDISSVSSGTSGKPRWHREDQQDQEFSFADLLEDARANQIGEAKGNDENITKMVSKVGRWWYSTCYEKPLLRTDNSIWTDPGLLRDCEKQGTSFRLLICYAQKPAQTRRRTVSV